MLRRHRSSMELLPHDVVELILERLPVESLLRFKSVSKTWKSTIESQRFQETQLIRRRQSRVPDVLCLRLDYRSSDDDDDDDGGGLDTDAQRSVLGSSIVFRVSSGSMYCHGSCDGLVCIYTLYSDSFVVNPATRCHRSIPPSSYQKLLKERYKRYRYITPELGFGKDKVKGTYKPVWLYNSNDFGLDNVTTCEVFDFSTNAWRYVLPASPYMILDNHKPVYLDGSLYWLTDCEETKILSLDLHTETFQVICKPPFAGVLDPYEIIMCILDNRLCVSRYECPTQVIWSLDSSSGSSKTWKKMCSLDLTKNPWFHRGVFPVAILENNKLLLHGDGYGEPLVIHDLHSKSYDLLLKPTNTKRLGAVCYFESLLSM